MSAPPTSTEFTALQAALRAVQAERDSWRVERDTLSAERDTLTGQNRVLRIERDLLKEQLARAIHKMFAARSEVRGSEQKDLFFNEAEGLAGAQTTTQAAPAEEESAADGSSAAQDLARVTGVASAAKPKRGRKPLAPALPRQVVRHELPVVLRICPHDGSTLVEIGVEASEQLDIIPQQVRVILHERVKYACPCCDGSLRVAAKPAQIIPKGLLTPAALAWVVTAKFEDGLPLYRQAALLGRFGGTDLSRNTLAASVVRVGQAVQPIINLLRDQLLDAPLVFGDETRLQVLKEPGRRAQTQSFMWAQMTQGSGLTGTGPPIHLFSYSPTRSAAAADGLYAGIRAGGALMSDGYEVYRQMAQKHGLVHLGCWAHARRYFVEAFDALPRQGRTPGTLGAAGAAGTAGASGQQLPPLAAQFIGLIAQLYAVEARAQQDKLDAAQRLQWRERFSVPVLARIDALLLTHLHAVVPGSLLGKALHYLHAQWPKLARFVTNGSFPIDNNPRENAIRPFVVGRRNWLFADTVAGAHASANLYSLLQTCKANRVEPFAYLTALFTALPAAQGADDYEALLPWNSRPPAA